MVNFSQLGRPMANLKLASTKIPIELVERLNRYTESTGSTQSAAIRQAIEQFLDSVESTKSTELTNVESIFKSSDLVTRVDGVDDRLTEIERRLTEIERRSPSPLEPIAAVTKFTTPNTTPKPTSPKPIAVVEGALTVKEALEKLGERGYFLGRESLRRALKPAIDSGIMPDELSALGLSADFEVRRSAKSSANNTRWLYLN